MVAKKDAKKPKTGDSRDSKAAATGDDLKKKEAVKEKASLQNPSGKNSGRTNEVPEAEDDKKMTKETDLKKEKSLKEETSSDKDAEDETGIMFMDAFDETSFGKQVKEDVLARPKKPESDSKKEKEEEKSKAKALMDRIKKLPFTIKADQSDKQEDKEDELIVPDPVEDGDLGEMCRHPELRRRGGRWFCCYSDTKWFCAKCDKRVTE